MAEGRGSGVRGQPGELRGVPGQRRVGSLGDGGLVGLISIGIILYLIQRA